jgi:protein O-mannosyl-transferase
VSPEARAEVIPEAVEKESGSSPPRTANRAAVQERYATILVAMALAIATLALYQHALQNSFTGYDDPAYVTRNLHVQRGLAGASIAWAFTSTAEANWHPITWLSHMADVQLFGARAAGHHFTNILLHTINVVLFFLLLRWGTGALLRSAMAAALFALHPLNVETVAWVAERKSLLSTLFLLFAVAIYARYAKKPSVAKYIVVAILFALGLMAKPMIVTLPFALLLLDYWPLQRFSLSGSAENTQPFASSLLKLFFEKIPLLLLSLASIAITMYAQRQGGAVGSVLLLPLDQRIKNAIYSYSVYLAKTFWPVRLAVFYPHPEGSLALWKVAASAVLLLVITALVLHNRQHRYLVTGWFWYLGTLVPVIGILQVGRQAMADRYAYLPLMGFFVMLVWLIAELVEPHAALQALALPAAVIALGGFAAVSYAQISYWQNSFALFTHALAVTPDNAIAEDNLGTALVNMGQLESSLPHFESAVRMAPQLSSAHYNLATVLHRQQQFAQAAVEYQLAIHTSVVPAEAAQAHNNLAVLDLQTSRIPEALAEFDSAIALNPSEQNSYIGRGTIELQQGRLDPAIADFTQAANVAPSPLANLWLGRAYELKGNSSAAIAAYENAVRLAPNFAEAQSRLNVLRPKAPH